MIDFKDILVLTFSIEDTCLLLQSNTNTGTCCWYYIASITDQTYQCSSVGVCPISPYGVNEGQVTDIYLGNSIKTCQN